MHYRVDLTKTEYGHKDAAGAKAYYYKWTDNGNGLEFEQTSDPSEAVITYYADPNRLAPDRITADQGGKPIDSDFLGKYVTSSYGGAIYNSSGTIGNITGDFIGNYVSSTSVSAYGGAIYNYDDGTIDDITGDFIGNYATSSGSSTYGGAIYNNGFSATIGDIIGDFIGNYVSSTNYYANGGAIYNGYTIGDITGDFIGNYASGVYARGGAIYSDDTIGDITGDFIGNYATSSGSSTYGGAIYNWGTIGDITGDFIGNYASSISYSANGGAIYNSDTIGDITGDFIGNYASGSSASGGAIYNSDTIGGVTGDFIGNYASATEDEANGGAIYNSNGTIGNIIGNFVGNYASGVSATGGAITNENGFLNLIKGDFIGNQAVGTQLAMGGAVANNLGYICGSDYPSDKTIQLSSVLFTNTETGESLTIYQPLNESQKEQLQEGYKVSIFSIKMGVSEDLWHTLQSRIDSNQEDMTLDFPVDKEYLTEEVGSFLNSNFIGNVAKSEDGIALGGAIFSTNAITVAADDGVSIFSGNKTVSQGVEEQNAIGMYSLLYDGSFMGSYLDTVLGGMLGVKNTENPAELTLKAVNNGVILFDDTIRGGALDANTMGVIETPETAFKLHITGDETGRVILNNDVINAKVSLDEVTLQLGREDVLNQSQSLTLNSGTLSLLNNGVGTMNLPNFSLNGAVNMAVDADLANKTMDRITADKYNISQDSKLNVNLINLISDAKEDKTDIEFADPSYSSQVSYTGDNPIAYSKIYKYDVSYNPEDGYFTFLRGSSSNPSDNFNPTVLSPAVTTQAAGYSTQMQVFNYAFQHSDNFMNLPYMDRLAAAKSNQYALINDSTVGPYSPIFTRVNQGGAWFKPYISFENIPLKNGPTVDNIAYGSLIGYDSKLTPIRHGFERVLTGYVGYNGASQSYPGVDTYQNGGLLGGTVTLYKGNFFNATTLSAGASVGESSNMYGHENYTMLLAGIGNKLGYNFEFQRGRYILQPSMLMSYTFVNTFDYTNSAGTRMTSDPLHAIQLSPGLKFIMNTKNGWQPYAAVNMVWNIFTDQNAKADNISLPNMSIKPYVQYGLGVQKLIKDKFLAFGQALVSNGGRNGISFSFGLRWLIGRE